MTLNLALRRLAVGAWKRSNGLLRALFRQENRLPARSGRKTSLLLGEEGAELVEVAMTLPILFGFVFGVIQVCLAFYTYEYISELAREGSRYAAFRGPSCVTSAGASCTATAAQINTYVQGLNTIDIGGGSMVVNTTYPGTGGELVNNPVKVTITYTFPYHIPFVMSKSLTMTSISQMTIVQ